MIEGLPVMDAHIHLDPGGTPKEAVKRFVSAGGTHLLIIHKPYHHIRENDLDAFRRGFETTISMSDLARENGVKAWCVIGPYPGGLPYLAKKVGLEKAKATFLEALDVAFRMIDEGRAIGIGEIGRVHFPVEEAIQNACDDILLEAMKGSRIRNCPVILHTESISQNPVLFDHLTDMADRTGFPRKRLIKHYAGWEEGTDEVGKGVSISMQARKKNMEKALELGLDVLLETDYIDEKERPDVVMPPDTVPKKISWAYRKGLMDKKRHERLMVDVPEETLGIVID